MAPGTLSNAVLDRLSDGQCHTIDHLDHALTEHMRREIVKCAGRLVLRGLLERVELGCYQLTEEGKRVVASGQKITSGPYRPDRGRSRKPRDTVRQRAWQAMQMPGSFTIGEIAMHAGRSSEGNLQKYFRALRLAGYLIELPIRAKGTAMTSNGFKRFRLIRDTGPIAPVYRPDRKTLFDYNLGDRGEEVSCL